MARTGINSLSDDLLIRILWHSEQLVCLPSESDILWLPFWPTPKYVSSNPSIKELRLRDADAPTPWPPLFTDAALSLRIASVCSRWRRLAQGYVSTLLVRENLAVPLEALSSAVACFPNLTHLHLCDGSVVTINDDFLAHLASSCPKLRALNVGKEIAPDYLNEMGCDDERENEHPVTPAGLDRFFRQSSLLERVSLFCLFKNSTLPASFFGLNHLHALSLTDPSALESPDFANMSSLASLSLEIRNVDGQSLMNVVKLAGLTSLTFCDDTRLSLRGEPHYFQWSSDPQSPDFSFALLSSLKSLRFETSSPPFDLMFPPESPCRNLERLLLKGCRGLERLPDDIGTLLPCLQEFSLESCIQLVQMPEQITSLSRLQTLKISSCDLLSLPEDFGELPALETLVLHKLAISVLPDSFAHLASLKTKILIGCAEFEELPPGFASLSSLNTLCLVQLPDLELPQNFGQLTNLQTLLLSKIHTESLLPPSFSQLSSLTRLELNECMLAELPQGMSQLKSLQQLYIQACPRVTEIPEFLSALTGLEILKVEGCSSLTTVPRELDSLKRVKKLEISNCESLVELPDSLPTSLEVLSLGNYQQVAPLPDISKLSRLKKLKLSMVSVSDVSELSFGEGLTGLGELELLLEGGATELPFNLASLSQLRSLILWTTGSMTKLPEYIGSSLQQLRRLCIHHGGKLAELPDTLTMLQNLTSIKIIMANLSSLPDGIGALSRLRDLTISTCPRFETLPASFTKLSSLTSLGLQHCPIQSLPSGFGQLTRLKNLYLHGCTQFGPLPEDIINLKMLQYLDVEECENVFDAEGYVQPRACGRMYGLMIHN